jgi:hypothetical protein
MQAIRNSALEEAALHHKPVTIASNLGEDVAGDGSGQSLCWCRYHEWLPGRVIMLASHTLQDLLHGRAARGRFDHNTIRSPITTRGN